MARITVEDCLDHADNRFALVILAAKRARQLTKNARPVVEHGKNKPAVMALREIAAGKVKFDRGMFVRRSPGSRTTPRRSEVEVRYLAHGDFHAALHRRVEAHFERSGVGPGPTPAMWWKTLIIIAWCAASYGLLTFWASSPWQALACSISLGLAVAGIGFNIQHDGGHGGYGGAAGPERGDGPRPGPDRRQLAMCGGGSTTTPSTTATPTWTGWTRT